MSVKKDVSFDLVLNYKTAKDVVTSAILAKEPVMIHGAPGVGKSDMLKIIAKELGRELIDIRLALLESVDIKGYPFLKEIVDQDGKLTGEKALSFAMNEEFPRDSKSTAIIFFDEINAAAPSTQLAMYQLILDRAIGNYILPEGVTMVAAGNREVDRGATSSMPKPLENRFMHIELRADFDSWVEYAITDGVHPEIIGYLGKNPEKLNSFDPQKSSRAFATPRSWVKASKMLKQNKSSDDKHIFNLLAACIGTPLASELSAFRKIANEIPNSMEILSGKSPKLKKDVAGADISYMVITNCLYQLKELYLASIAGGSKEKFRLTDDVAQYFDNFLSYLIENEKVFGGEFTVLAITIAINNYQIPVSPKKMPSLAKILTKYDNLLTVVNQPD